MTKKTAIKCSAMRGLTDRIYYALFGMSTWDLLRRFKLPVHHLFDEQDNELRDRMGIHALQALAEIETELTKRFQWIETMPEDWDEMTAQVGESIGAKYKALAEQANVNFLTGDSL